MMKPLFYSAFLLLAIPCLAQDGTTTITTQQTTTSPGNGSVGISFGGMGTTTQQTTITTTTTTTTGTPPAAQAPPPPQATPIAAPAPTGCQNPMEYGDYEGAKKSIAAKDFEDTKLTLAKQISDGNCLAAEQIRGIMKLFTFENSKLDFAKYAYSHCTDKSNYFKVDDAFEFDNSSKELNDYISNHQ
jgi:hypothetical protein